MGEGPKDGPPDAEQRTHLTVSVRWGGRAVDRDGRAGARFYDMFVCKVGMLWSVKGWGGKVFGGVWKRVRKVADGPRKGG